MFAGIKKMFQKEPVEDSPPADPAEYIAWASRNKEPTCPDCREGELLAGPQGGMSINFACPKCMGRFNMAIVGGQVYFFERTGKVDERTLAALFE